MLCLKWNYVFSYSISKGWYPSFILQFLTDQLNIKAWDAILFVGPTFLFNVAGSQQATTTVFTRTSTAVYGTCDTMRSVTRVFCFASVCECMADEYPKWLQTKYNVSLRRTRTDGSAKLPRWQTALTKRISRFRSKRHTCSICLAPRLFPVFVFMDPTNWVCKRKGIENAVIFREIPNRLLRCVQTRTDTITSFLCWFAFLIWVKLWRTACIAQTN